MNNFLQQAVQIRQPILRHLLWLVQARQLIRGTSVFEPKNYLQPEHWEKIVAWDADSATLPSRLSAEPKRLLGLYVEELYHCLLEDLLGWRVVARNLPIYGGGRTIGEFDFLVQDPETEVIEHHEIAIKFYLAYGKSGGVRWYGPNPADRLDLKTQRMLNHQSQLSGRPEALPTLHSLGLYEPVEPRLFMPGYLFYPKAGGVDGPRQADPDHARGWWVYEDQVDTALGKNTVTLDKPHWLGPWLQEAAPDEAVTNKALENVRTRDKPGLFAQLEWHEGYQLWIERQRFFVVPRSWPN